MGTEKIPPNEALTNPIPWIEGIASALVMSEYHLCMGVSTSLAFEDFERLQDDGKKHELLKGEHISLPPAKSRRSNVQHRLLRV